MTDAAPTLPWADGRLRHTGAGGPRILFAQMHEDPAVELAAIATLPANPRVFAIASGGCTALSLLTSRPSVVHAVDINPAQAHLVELKRALVSGATTEGLQQAMDADATSAHAAVRATLPATTQLFWDGRPALLRRGLEHCGDIDISFARLQRAMWLAAPRRARRLAILSLRDSRSQADAFAREWNTWRWRAACRFVMSRTLLRRVYGEEFLAAVPNDAAAQVLARISDAFARTPLADNGYLWQTFAGAWPPDDAGRPPYQRHAMAATVREQAASLKVHTADAATWLEQQAAGSIDFFAVSNIFEGAAVAYAERLVAAMAHAASAGAILVVRAIFGVRAEVRVRLLATFTGRSDDIQAFAVLDRSAICVPALLLRAPGAVM